MSTITAIKPRPLIFQNQFVTMELVPALKEDVQEFYGWDNSGTEPKKTYVPRVGLVYWVFSTLKNKLEETPRKIKQDEDPYLMKEMLDNKMIYIAKNQF